ncbi:hypothetical protein T484DRAFT_1859527, partial [Baffinella frigidus]
AYYMQAKGLTEEEVRAVQAPAWLIHGSGDQLCPLQGAWALQEALPAAVGEVLP